MVAGWIVSANADTLEVESCELKCQPDPAIDDIELSSCLRLSGEGANSQRDRRTGNVPFVELVKEGI